MVQRYDKKLKTGKYDGYLLLSATGFLFVFIYVSRLIGFPELVAAERLLSSIQFVNLSLFVVPVDFFISLQQNHRSFRSVINFTIGVICTAVLLFTVFRLDLYHGNQYLELTRYNSVVDVTEKIASEFPRAHFTIVSTTDELYEINEEGFHEEMLDFLWENETSDHYTIPTPYLFIYVEKNSIYRSQFHRLTAPEWLADRSKESIFVGVEGYSEDPDISKQASSEEYADMDLPPKSAAANAAKNLETRLIMNAKMHEWAQAFSALHPHDISVYYEDDDFVCYLIEQNPARLFELAIS